VQLASLTKMGDRENHNVIPRYVVVAGVALLLGLTVLAIAFAVQDHEGRALAEDLDRTGVELKVLGGQIADIKDADLVSMNDYAYAQVEHLQSDYDQKLQVQRVVQSCAEERQRSRNLQRRALPRQAPPETWENMTEIIDLVRQINELTKRQTAVVDAMASLPEPERVKFWHEQFAPRGRGARAAREAAGRRTGNAAWRKSSIGPQEVPPKPQAVPRRSFFLQTVSVSLRQGVV
jgi:hypothetical protein